MELKQNEKLDIEYILKDLDKYRPRRRGWTWRKGAGEKRKIGKFEYYEMTENLKNSQPLPAAKYFDNIDPQHSQSLQQKLLQVDLKMILEE